MTIQAVNSGLSPVFLNETGTRQAATGSGFANESQSSGTDTTITPGAGLLVVTGYSPTVTSGTIITPGAGALLITGYAPSVAFGTVITPGAGSLLIAGFAPTVTNNSTGNTTITPGAGSLVITGYAPTFTSGSVLTPGAGSVQVTGYAPTVASGTVLTPGSGVLTITGYAPTVTNQSSGNTTITPGAGVLVITGYAPTVSGAAASAQKALNINPYRNWMCIGSQSGQAVFSFTNPNVSAGSPGCFTLPVGTNLIFSYGVPNGPLYVFGTAVQVSES